MQSSQLTNRFGTSEQRVLSALTALSKGGGVLLVDDEERENEGDLIFPAETITPSQMAMLIRECSGIVCLCLTDSQVKKLALPQMVDTNTSANKTAFTVSIEAKRGVTTGVSAKDRVQTIRTAVDSQSGPEDLSRPGHVFPLRAEPGGVFSRRGHTEGTVDLMELAGLKNPAGVLCELTNPDGTMARLPKIMDFGDEHAFPVVTIEDLWKFKSARQVIV